MTKTRRFLSWRGAALAVFAALNVAGGAGLVREAEAIVGAPMTPLSVAGVARRTAYRSTAAASSSAAASQQAAATSQQQAAAAQQQAQIAQQQTATAQAQAAAARLPVGTTVSALPQGCTSVQVTGTSYFNCGGTYYKPAFQSNNVVYIVAQP